eukprot:RCo021319
MRCFGARKGVRRQKEPAGGKGKGGSLLALCYNPTRASSKVIAYEERSLSRRNPLFRSLGGTSSRAPRVRNQNGRSFSFSSSPGSPGLLLIQGLFSSGTPLPPERIGLRPFCRSGGEFAKK